MPHARRLASALLAPATLLERSRGRKRLALASVYVLILAFLGAWAWRTSRLAGLPDRGAPFDTETLLLRAVSPDRDAFVEFKAAARTVEHNRDVETRILGPYAWPAKDPEALAFLAASRPTLDLWRRGCDKSDALYLPIKDLGIETRLNAVQEHRHFVRLALVEATHCLDHGDMAGAWGWYRAILRGSRLVGRNNTVIARLVGMAEYGAVQPAIGAWAADPRTAPELLRRALDDVRAANALTPPHSETLQVEYLLTQRTFADRERVDRMLLEDVGGPIDDPGLDRLAWYSHLHAYRRARNWLKNEPEVGLRMIDLVFANWLAHCDRPPADRPPLIGPPGKPGVLFDAPGPPGPASPAELAGRIESSPLMREVILTLGTVISALDRDRRQQAALVVALADRLYTVERGRAPASADDLVGPYLDRLPDGYVRPEPDAESPP